MPARRYLLTLGAMLAAGLSLPLPRQSHAQPARWPDKPVRIFVGFPPGQATDIVARQLAERLSPALGQAVLVENRPGQGGSMVLAQVAKAAPDGLTLTLAATAALVINPHLYPSVGYDTLRDFAPIGTVADLPLVLVAHPSMPFNSFAEFVAHAKAQPDRLRYASSGNGTLSHLGMELLKSRAGVKMLHVPYKGSVPAMTDLAGGSVDIGLDTVAGVMPHLQSKRLKLIAAASERRLAFSPDTPTIAESGMPGFAASAWLGLLAPKGTPADVVQRLSDELGRILRDPATEQALRALSAYPRPGAAADLARLLARENESWARVVRESGVKPD